MREISYKDPRKHPVEIGRRIRAAREAAGLTQAQLAEKVGTSQQTIEKIELGKVQRSSFIYPIYEVLELQGAPLHNYDPAPRGNTFDYRGIVFQTRREYLGLEPSELSALAGVSAEEIQALERLGEGLPEARSDHLRHAMEVHRALLRLEGEEELGEPQAPFAYHMSALPNARTPLAYFRMGVTKGVSLQGYVARPTRNAAPPSAFAYCFETASWARGIVSAGDRLYCEALPPMWPDVRRKALILLTPVVRTPEEVSEVIVGELVDLSSIDLTLNVGGGNSERFDLNHYLHSIIFDAAWTNETFSKFRGS